MDGATGLSLATLGGARVLGIEAGTIDEGKWADLALVEVSPGDLDPERDVLEAAAGGAVAVTVVGGAVAAAAGRGSEERDMNAGHAAMTTRRPPEPATADAARFLAEAALRLRLEGAGTFPGGRRARVAVADDVGSGHDCGGFAGPDSDARCWSPGSCTARPTGPGGTGPDGAGRRAACG